MSETLVEILNARTGSERPPSSFAPRLLHAVREDDGYSIEHGVPLLHEDRGLAVAAPREHLEALRQVLRVDVVKLTPGAWHPAGVPMEPEGAAGLLVLDGFLTRCIGLSSRHSAEVLGPGDLLRPWDWSGEDSICVDTAAQWRVCEPARIALLDRRFNALAGRCPDMTSELMNRLTRRSRLLAVLLALTQVRQLKRRVLLAALDARRALGASYP